MAWNDDGKYHITTAEDVSRLKQEQRAHPSHHTNWNLYGFQTGYDTAAGKQVDEESAQSLTVVYACVRAISETVGSLPFHLYKKLSEDKRERAKDHPIYPIINRKPNPEMIDMIFRETMLLHLNTWGNFYANLEYDKANYVTAMWPLRPDRMDVQRVGKQVKYVYTLESGEQRLLDRTEVLHIPGLGFDGMIGYSPIKKNKEAIGLSIAAEEYGARYFQNDARPGVILKHPGELSEPAQDRLRKSWEDMHKGLSNKHRLGILEEGMDFATIGVPPGEAQWIELRNFQIPEICRIYRVPPPIIGDLSRATFSNVEELTRHFAIHCIRPWLVRVEQIYNDKLLKPSEHGEYYVEHVMDAMMRADMVARYNAYSTGRQWGWLSANDVLRKENMDAIEGGDIYLSPGNMVPSDMVGKQPPAAPGAAPAPGKGGLGGKENEKKDEPWLDDVEYRMPEAEVNRLRDKIRDRQNLEVSFKPLFDSCFERIVNREILALEKAVSKSTDELRNFFDDLYEKMDDYIREASQGASIAHRRTW